MTDPIADALLVHYLIPAPAPASPKPTWTPSSEAARMVFAWAANSGQSPARDFLRRLYAQLHRDRVAALVTAPGFSGVSLVEIPTAPVRTWLVRDTLLALADDGNGD